MTFDIYMHIKQLMLHDSNISSERANVVVTEF